ncbi:hypothetical protein L3Q65_24280 [Amycolatopsis sp. FU40]|uniref:hypothetical protein n=1 Tax=Amycolatopsis sp. FU40 TaxID=2914159 RepID=UPI001F4834F2|nr:hypothetical protein [Amycolatopsis sp. FU40]UKD51049.1 hypothetical protein L3Q65_24280 [Amycolatopsis sp. FU40]
MVEVTGSSARRDPVVSAVSIMVKVVVGLTFTFGFGNVLALALRLGVPVWVVPLVAPAVVELLIAIRRVSACDVGKAGMRSARLLLMGTIHGDVGVERG